MADPLACLSGPDKWVKVNMGEAMLFERWARGNPEFQSLFNICFNGLVSGNILIETGPPKAKPKGGKDKIELPDPDQEAANHWRSRVVTSWSREKEFTRLCMGFVPVTGVPVSKTSSEHCHGGDQYEPVVLNLSKIEIWTKVDVYSRREWKVYETATAVQLNQRRELRNIKMFGDEWPDASGHIQSCVKRIYLHAYEPYMSKVLLTMDADRKRANPVITTQSNERNDAQKNMSEQGPAFENTSEMERTPSAIKVHALVATLNSADGACGSEDVKRMAGKRKRANEYSIRDGQEYVSAHLAEAPADTLSFSQHYLEVICLAFGVPMSMVSSGDATGKAKLNSETAGPETARIFREAQSERKRRIESDLQSIYRFMWTEQDLVDKSKSLKRPLDKKDVDEALQIRVSIPANPQMEKVVEMWEKGVLKYGAMCSVLSNQLGLSVDNFNEEAGIDIKDLQGIAPPETGGGAASSKPKKKKAKK